LIFATFGEALAAMVRIGMEADKAGHHPEWSNVDNRLDIWLTTHDIDGISDRDLALANVINSMFPAERTPDQAGYEALSTGWVRY
jgi:4a-hydroxytetrahydrobiopterin dehydratase